MEGTQEDNGEGYKEKHNLGGGKGRKEMGGEWRRGEQRDKEGREGRVRERREGRGRGGKGRGGEKRGKEREQNESKKVREQEGRRGEKRGKGRGQEGWGENERGGKGRVGSCYSQTISQRILNKQ